MDERNDLPADETSTDEMLDSKNAYSEHYGSLQEVLSRYTHCALCGANLHFIHSTDFSRNLTLETAKCPECGVKARRVMHRLQ